MSDPSDQTISVAIINDVAQTLRRMIIEMMAFDEDPDLILLACLRGALIGLETISEPVGQSIVNRIITRLPTDQGDTVTG